MRFIEVIDKLTGLMPELSEEEIALVVIHQTLVGGGPEPSGWEDVKREIIYKIFEIQRSILSDPEMELILNKHIREQDE